MFLWRLLHTIDKGDEVQNITMAYRLVLGQKPWVDVWEIFQSGNSFASPVIWLLVKMTGSTEGIIFFVRGAFLLMNLFLGAVLFFALRKYISKSILGVCILAIICYAPFSLYYIWYDSMGLYFMLLGEILLFTGLQSEKSFSWSIFFAGVSHALMSYAYPSFVLLAFAFAGILYWLNKKKKKKYETFMQGRNAISMEDEITQLFSDMDFLKVAAEKNNRDIKKIYENLKVVYQKVGVVRYDAFQQMGGQLSFSIALLNGNNNGFIINSVHSSDGCYTYTKEI